MIRARVRIALLAGALGVVVALMAGPAAAPPSAGAPIATPASIPVGLPTSLKVTSQITDPTVLTGGVNLQKVNAGGDVLATLGVMRDDGLGGDAVAGDGIFTLVITVNEPAPGELRLRVSAAFRGLLRRVLSPISVVPVAPVVRLPIALAGPDQNALLGTTVVLDGSDSYDQDGALITFQWTLAQAPAGSAAVLAQATQPAPSFVPDIAGVYALDLVVHNGQRASVADRVNVTAFMASAPPNARAGRDQTVLVGTPATLDGGASFHAAGAPLQFHWAFVTRPAGSQVTDTGISGSGGAVATFVPDVAGTYVLSLTVGAGQLADTDTVQIVARSANVPPRADAGVDRVLRAKPVHLDGSDSADLDGAPSPLTFAWTLVSRPAGSTLTTASIVGAGSATPTFTPDADGSYVFRLRVSDGAAIDEDNVLVVFLTNHPPVAFADIASTQQNTPVSIAVLANDSDPDGDLLTVTVSTPPTHGTAVVNGNGTVTYTPASGFAGADGFTYAISDGFGGTASAGVTITVTNVNDPPTVTLNASPRTGTAPLTVTFTAAATDPDNDTLTYTWDFGDGAVITGAASESHTYTAAGTFTAKVTASDGALSASATTTVTVNPAGTSLPPDPAAVAPPLPRGTGTDIKSATEFLYSGTDPIQTGVAPGTIDAQKVAILRGRALTRDGGALSAVTITVQGRPEFGQTLSRADGAFDLVVNGGGPVTVRYERNGFLVAHRTITAPWRDYALLPDVALVPLDAQATAIASGAAAIQIARGTRMTDAAGSRQSTLLFMPGTTASMTLPNGSAQPLSGFTVRATEFTVGPFGPTAMPGLLPATSAYTYAVELSADEALAAAAVQVTFSQPVIKYLDNFLGFPVGWIVPVGYFDRQRAVWVASDNGRVVKIVAITAGLAELDTDGDGVVDNGVALGVTAAERQTLGALYAAGQSLWRAPIPHFTPWDLNHPWAPPADAVPPRQPVARPPGLDDGCDWVGSIIQCHNQTVAEQLPVTGTGYRLRHQSDRTPGYLAAYTIDIPISGATVPASLKRIRLELAIAGRRFTHDLSAAPNQSFRFTWDGLDAYGRRLLGAAQLYVKIGYVYDLFYFPPADAAQAFAQISRAAGTGTSSGITLAVPDVTRNEVTISQEYKTSVGAWDARASGLGGWSLNIHHGYDPAGGVVYLGSGGRRSGNSTAGVIEPFAGPNSARGFTGDGGPALTAQLYEPKGLAVARDGSVYIADMGNHRIRRVSPSGIINTVAGSGPTCPNVDTCVGQFGGDGGPATSALLNMPRDVAVAADGSLVIADTSNFRIRRVDPSGTITTIAGTGVRGSTGDGGLATLAQVGFLSGIALAPDGSVYFSESTAVIRIRRIDPKGIITTIAGGGTPPPGSNGDGGAATAARLLASNGLTVGPDGSVYTLDLVQAGVSNPPGIRKIGPDGIINNIAAIPGLSNAERYIAFGPDGKLYATVCCPTNIGTLRLINPEGTTTVVGGGVTLTTDIRFIGPNGDGGAATQADLLVPQGMAVAPDGTTYVTSNIPLSVLGSGSHRVRRIRPPYPGFSVGDIPIASEDGTELWVFDSRGRHLRTHDALTGAAKYQFTYDADGRLLGVSDVAGNVTSVERGGGGAPLAIVAPGGQRTALTLDAAGFLITIANPAGETTRFTHTADGLLATFIRSGGGVSRFTYDALGRLTRDDSPDGNVVTLSRTENATGFSVQQRSTLGRVVTYALERLADGSERRRTTDPSGRVTEVVSDVKGTQTAVFADGTRMTLTTKSDPRFGTQTRVLDRLAVTLPGGSVSTTTQTRSVTLPASGDVLHPTSISNGTSINGRFTSVTWQGSTRTITTITPAGRQSVVTLDALGRIVTLAPAAGLSPISWTYDMLGRVSQVTRGAQSWTLAYDTRHRLISRTDALGTETRFEYDAADRMTRIQRASGNDVRFAYDSDGNLVAVIMPSGAVHTRGFTAAGRERLYAPPGGVATTRTYDPDGAPVHSTLADGRVRDSFYDSAGRLVGQTFPEASLEFFYDPAVSTTGVSRMTRTPVTGLTQDIALTWDGPLPTKAVWSGAATGQYTYGYDVNQFLTSMNLASGSDAVPLAITRDTDGLPTGYGPFTLTRGGPGGATSQMSDGTAVLTLAWDGLGRQVDRTQTVAGTQVYRVQLGHNASGRLTQKTETIGGVARVFDYIYDADGQLLQVSRDGTVVERYTYDTNGNRISRTLPGGATESALYDVADRLIQRGAVAVASNAEGYVTTIGSVSLVYDVRGALTRAAANGRTIDYAYDALGRRVSRTDPAGTTQYLYGNPSDPMQVTAVRDAAGVLTALFYDEDGRLIALARGGARFSVGTDHLGTPRVVTDATGAVMKRLDHDSYGVPLADSNPAFVLPIGFAGGLTDSDTGLLRFGFRDYDPAAGRWTARDPALFSGGQANLYAYVGNGPVAYRDPLGLFAFCFGFSFYVGYGGGLSVCTSGNDLSVCGEVGLGIGGGVGGAIDGQMPRDNRTVGLEAGAQCGPIAIGGGVTLDDCGDLKAGPAVNIGLEGVGGINVSPVSVSPGTVSAGLSAEDITTEPGGQPTGKAGQMLQDRTPTFAKGKCQLGGKLAASGCRGLF